MNSLPSLPPSTPSRLNPWPYAITGAFALFFSAMAAFVVVATRQKVDLVRADYYEQEILFQKQIDRVQRTRALPEPFTATVDTNSALITLRFPSAHTAAGIHGTVSLYRPSDSALDLAFPIKPNSEGVQMLPISSLAPGRWRARIEWSSAQLDYFYELEFNAPHPRTPSVALNPAQIP